MTKDGRIWYTWPLLSLMRRWSRFSLREETNRGIGSLFLSRQGTVRGGFDTSLADKPEMLVGRLTSWYTPLHRRARRYSCAIAGSLASVLLGIIERSFQGLCHLSNVSFQPKSVNPSNSHTKSVRSRDVSINELNAMLTDVSCTSMLTLEELFQDEEGH